MSKRLVSRELEAWCDGLNVAWKIETVRDFIPHIRKLERKIEALEMVAEAAMSAIDGVYLPEQADKFDRLVETLRAAGYYE